MNRLRLPGEVTFMPLNRLDARDTQYPDTTVGYLYPFTPTADLSLPNTMDGRVHSVLKGLKPHKMKTWFSDPPSSLLRVPLIVPL